MFKRSDSGTNYPYVVPNVMEITDSEYGTNYYYYFYNWKISFSSEGCESDPTLIELDVLINLAEEIKTNFNLYPNPSSNQISIDFNLDKKENVTLKVVDISGRTVFLKTIENQLGKVIYDIDLSFLENGTYYVSVITEKSLETKQLILQQ